MKEHGGQGDQYGDDDDTDNDNDVKDRKSNTCKNKVDKETTKEGEEGEGRETPGKGNSPGRRQG